MCYFTLQVRLTIFGENQLYLSGHCGVGLVEECLNVELCELCHNLLDLGLGLGVLGGEDGAAVLVGQDRGIKGAVVARLNDYLIFVKSDAGAEDGDVYDRVGNADCGEGLRGYLTERLTRDERAAFVLAGATLCKAHHKDTEKESEEVLLTVVADLFLDMG